MWTWQPAKWLLWAPIMAGLPYIAAAWLNTAALYTGIKADVTANLATIGADWAKPAFDGRDVKLGGDAPNEAAIDAAVAAIKGTYGVRAFTDATRVVAPLPPAVAAPAG
jgi:hypothetical protein